MEYEAALHERLKHSRIVAFCSYHRGDCGPVEVLDVVNRHDGALERSERRWEIVLPDPKTRGP